MTNLSYKIIDIYNFVETKKSRLRENIRYEFLLNCDKSIESVWKWSGYAAYNVLRGNSSKSVVLEKEKQHWINSKNLICAKWGSVNGGEDDCRCNFIVNWFTIMINNWEFLKNCYLLLVNGNKLPSRWLIKGWLNRSENNKFGNRIRIMSSKLEFQFAWNKKKPVNK